MDAKIIIQKINKKRYKKLPENGQSLIILALSFVAMLAFIGLVIDVGSLYVTYTQLKRAVDAAAVAAANNIKSTSSGFNKGRLTEAAREMLALNNVTDVSSLEVYLCSDSDIPAEFASVCPSSGESPRKLAWVQATQNSPVYFLSLFGVQSIPFTTSAVGEAATIDLVLVFDSSESMADETYNYDPNEFDPSACNSSDTCEPMNDAKSAAKNLVENLWLKGDVLSEGYDQVAIVSYSYTATAIVSVGDPYFLTDDMNEAKNRISSVNVHNDPDSIDFAWVSKSPVSHLKPEYNPIYPEDRDGDGYDADPQLPCVDDYYNSEPTHLGKDMWDDVTEKICDDYPDFDDPVLDTIDRNKSNVFGDEETPSGMPLTENNASSAGIILDPDQHVYEGTSFVSTCIGCGLRIATDILKSGGRESSLWVIVLLTDGFANLSDNDYSYSEIPSNYIYGFCGSNPDLVNSDILNETFWLDRCVDKDLSTRWCIDSDTDECPTGSSFASDSAPYSVADNVLDMADAAALMVSNNSDEPLGEDIIIYTIAFGSSAAANSYGVDLLRYMANVGEDGTRANDACESAASLTTNCGNYFYAPDGAYLDQVFENIAGRIFTKISR